MSVNFFYSHSLKERVDLISRKGEFISKIRSSAFLVHLYICEGIYVEAYLNLLSNSISYVEIIDHTDERLNLYATTVSISDLNL